LVIADIIAHVFLLLRPVYYRIDNFNSNDNSPFEISILSFDEFKKIVEEKDS
jgi:hypothetical protein